MKKLLYSALALAGIFAVSCTKEIDAPQKVELTGKTHTVVLTASFDDSNVTRTSYADNKTFSWVAGDVIRVRCLNETTDQWYWADFTAQSTAATSDFVGEVEDGFTPYDIAVYVPGSKVASLVYDEADVAVVMPISYHLDGFGLGYDAEQEAATPYWNSVSVPSSNPLSALALVSKVQDEQLVFQTGVGALNLNLTDVPSNATHVRIVTSNSKYLGNYLMVKDAQITNESPYVEQEEGKEDQVYATSFMEYYFQPASDGKASLYIPLPVGTLPAGSGIAVLDSEDNVLFSQAFVKDVTITRNKILKLTELKARVDWNSLGTGKFYDWYNFYYMSGSEDYATVDVEIQQDADNANHFRVVNPYGAAATKFGYTAPEGTTAASQYLEFEVTADGHVVYDATCTGVFNSTYEEATYIDAPYGYSDFGYGRNYVVQYASDGTTPAQVAMAPIIRWPVSGYWTGSSYINDDNFIEIDFPGATPVKVLATAEFTEIVDDTPAQPIASVTVSLGNAFTSAQLVIAQNETDAAAAFTAGTAVTSVSASGSAEVKLPANAPSGEYYVYAKAVPATGVSALAANTYVSEKSFQYDRSDETWIELGTGKYTDNYILGDINLPDFTYADVEIIQSPSDAKIFRVRSPYGALIEKAGYEAPASAIAPGEFLEIQVAADGSVYYKEHSTGIYYSSSQFSGTYTIVSPLDYASQGFSNDHNYVARYGSDGKPANIIMSPVYTWPPTSYWTGSNLIARNDLIQVVFPGYSPVDLVCTLSYDEIVDDDVAQPIAKVLFDPGADVAGANIVIAASLADAQTALATSGRYTVANGPGSFEVKLPANAASGTYYVYAQTIVATGISEKASELIVSDQFKYDRSDEDLGIKPGDLAGSYTGAGSSTFGGNGWASDTFDVKIEVSDDENYDIKFTTFVEDATDGMGIYAILDGATGKVTIDPDQVYATYSFWVDNDAQGNKVYQDLDLVLIQCGTSGGYLVPESTPIIMRYNKTAQTLTVESRQYLGIKLLDHETGSHFNYLGFMYGPAATGNYLSFTKSGATGGKLAPSAKGKVRQLKSRGIPSVPASLFGNSHDVPVK